MNSTDPASGAQHFLLANQVQRIIREGQPQAAKRVELLEKLLQIEQAEAAAAAASQAPTPSPAPMATTPGGLKIHGR